MSTNARTLDSLGLLGVAELEQTDLVETQGGAPILIGGIAAWKVITAGLAALGVGGAAAAITHACR